MAEFDSLKEKAKIYDMLATTRKAENALTKESVMKKARMKGRKHSKNSRNIRKPSAEMPMTAVNALLARASLKIQGCLDPRLFSPKAPVFNTRIGNTIAQTTEIQKPFPRKPMFLGISILISANAGVSERSVTSNVTGSSLRLK